METDMPRERAPEKSRAQLLEEIAALPPTAFLTPLQAGAYLATTTGVLDSWRKQRRGPRYFGANAFARYRICDLDAWMSTRANEIIERPENAFNVSPPRLIWSNEQAETTTADHQPEPAGQPEPS
jgi:hypothetical protein